MESEIVTRAEQAPPLDVATVDAVTRLLAQMERTALAQRPIVLPAQGSANLAEGAQICAPSRAPQTAPAGADVPMPPASAFTAVTVDRPQWWPIVFVVSGVTGMASCATAAATGSSIAILAVFACAGVWGTSVYQLVFNRKG